MTKKKFFIINLLAAIGLVIFWIWGLHKISTYFIAKEINSVILENITALKKATSTDKTAKIIEPAGEKKPITENIINKMDNLPKGNIIKENILPVKKSYFYSFAHDGVIEESGEIFESLNPNWSVSSGAYLYLENKIGKTIQGDLDANDKWRLIYNKDNPIDTDNGYRPQNIFRLVQRGSWLNFSQEVYYKITKDNFSDSPNRNSSNGLLLFNRYQDANNLYYTGIRVDGAATIKKKVKGVYYTLAYEKFLGNNLVYNRDNQPSLLPKNIWLGLKTEVTNLAGGQVLIKFYLDRGKTGSWQLLLEATDDGKTYGGPALTKAGMGGMRTDFMDVEFSDYNIGQK